MLRTSNNTNQNQHALSAPEQRNTNDDSSITQNDPTNKNVPSVSKRRRSSDGQNNCMHCFELTHVTFSHRKVKSSQNLTLLLCLY